MQCCIRDCTNAIGQTENGITFHRFPNDRRQRKAWMKALGISEWELGEHSRVCSKHFLDEDFYLTSGQHCIRNGAVPFVMKVSGDDDDTPAKYRVCRICLAIDKEMYHIRECGLLEAYENVTGLKMKEDSLPQKVCCECAQHLTSSYDFRNKALLANHFMLKTLQDSIYISIRDIKSINSTENQLKSSLSDENFEAEVHDDKIENNNLNTDDNINTHIKEIEDFNSEVKTAFALEDYTVTGVDDGKSLIDDSTATIVKDKQKHTDSIIMNIDQSDDDDAEDVSANEEKNVSYVSKEYHEKRVDNTTSQIEKDKQTHTDDFIMDTDQSDDDFEDFNACEETNVSDDAKNDSTLDKYLEQFCDIIYTDGDLNVHKLDELCNLDAKMSVTKLTVEEEIEKINQRKDTDKYKNAEYKCEICYKGLQSKKFFDKHMLRHSDVSGLHECNICKIRTKSKNAKRLHLSAVHGHKYTCTKCGFETVHKHKATAHLRWHQGAKFECSVCQRVFEHQSTLRNHIRSRHASSIICELCGYNFVNEKGLQQHKKRTHLRPYTEEELVGPYCETCDVKFLDEEAHYRHLRLNSRHNTDDSTERRGRGPDFRPRREKRKLQTEPKLLPCELCGVQLLGGHRYARHFRLCHPGEKSQRRGRRSTLYICEQCGKAFKSRALLTDHLGVHSEKRNHHCDQCNKAFFTKLNLNLHKKVHMEDRPTYNCSDCGKIFATIGGFNKHRITMHTPMQEHKCDICDKTFTQAAGLGRHIDHVHKKVPYRARNRNKKRRNTADLKPNTDDGFMEN